MNAISIQNVSKHFKDAKAVQNVSLNIQKGEFVALLGHNGAGKTTLMEMIEGLIKPTNGVIEIFNKTWCRYDHQKELKKIIGVCLQETHFTDKLSVWETIKLYASFYGLTTAMCYTTLDKVGLLPKKGSWVNTLSGGEKQRLAIAIALINDPLILIMDEPSTGLDPHTRRTVWNIIKALKKKDTTFILTTHYLEEAERLCERLVIMEKGSIIADEPLKDFYGKIENSHLIEIRTTTTMTSNQITNHLDIKKHSFNKKTTTITLEVANLETSLPKIIEFCRISNNRIEYLNCHTKSLDDLFIELTSTSSS